MSLKNKSPRSHDGLGDLVDNGPIPLANEELAAVLVRSRACRSQLEEIQRAEAGAGGRTLSDVPGEPSP